MSHPLDFFKFKSGILSAEQTALNRIVQEVGTPVYVYSSTAILTQISYIQERLNGLNYMICFAMKSNSNTSILKLISKANVGMDVVSGGELYRAKLAQVPSDRIIFSGVGKTEEEMRLGLGKNEKDQIYSFNIESIQELKTLNQIALKLKTQAPVALRFNPDVNPKTHPYISTGQKFNKFGLNEDEILQTVHQIQQLPGILLKGLSIHIGSQLLSLKPYQIAFSKLAALIEKIRPYLKAQLQFIDLGGGLGITYKNERTPSLPQYCKLIHKYFGKQSKLKGSLKIILEPGRQISGNAGVLLTQVLYRKERQGQDFLIVDAGMTDLIRPALYESYHEILPIQQSLLKGPRRKVTLVGPICESSDIFGKNRILSKNLNSGDILAVLSAGAYGFSMANQYNSRPRPPEVLVHKDQYQVIRRRESYEDLVRGEALTSQLPLDAIFSNYKK